MDRCALFVDAGYLLADGAMAVHGTRHREAVSWDFSGLLQLLTDLGRERTGLAVLRCYWYEATVDGRSSPEHDALADLPGLKLRLTKIRPGRREGVDAQVHRDVMTLARNNAICDAVVISGDEDLTQVVVDAQDLGIRVSVVNVAVESSPSVSRLLRRECDDFIEISPGHLRPFVNVIAGDATSAPMGNGQAPMSNGRGSGSRSASPSSGPSSRAALPYSGYHSSASSGYQPGAHSSEHQQPVATGPQPVVMPPQTPSTPSPPSQPATQSPSPAPPSPAPPSTPSPRGSHAQPAYGSTYNGPQAAPIASSPQQQQQSSLSEAVKAAHKEGTDFGDSVARDAPALWLEAVLARKPRMPSDLEARLLQGSSLPIDHLLHDEVRHALRRGFWDALERSRR